MSLLPRLMPFAACRLLMPFDAICRLFCRLSVALLLRFWLLKVDAQGPADSQARLNEYVGRVLRSPTPMTTGSAANIDGENKHNLFQASAWPCTCAYIGGGIHSGSRCFQYGNPNGLGDLPMTGTSGAGHLGEGNAGTCCDKLFEQLGVHLLSRIGKTMNEAKSTLPTYAVAHEYPPESRQCMEHESEPDQCCHAEKGEMVTFRFIVSRAEVFCVKPAIGKEFANTVMGTSAHEEGWLLPVCAAENSIIVMGGHFHEQMLGYSILPDQVHKLEFEGSAGQLTLEQYRNAEKDLSTASPRQALDLIALSSFGFRL